MTIITLRNGPKNLKMTKYFYRTNSHKNLYFPINFYGKEILFCKIIPRRPDFAQTMTDEERSIMQQHVSYWKEYVNMGMVLVYGPVIKP